MVTFTKSPDLAL